MILIAKGWQKGPSQILPPSCRYQPSCSAYAITAIERYGAARGAWMALKRILRCNPWGGQGYDPVPERIEKKCCLLYTSPSPRDTERSRMPSSA